jgi:hypothetical protein
MASTVTAQQLARQMDSFAKRLPLTAERALRTATDDLTTQVNRGYARALGADQRLSGTARGAGRRGARVRAAGDVRGQRNPVGRVRVLGPAQFIEGDTRPHFIGASALGTRAAIRRRGVSIAGGSSGRGLFRQVYRAQVGRGVRARDAKRALTISAGANGLRAYAQHPGTRAQRVFWPTVEREQPKIARTFDRFLSTDMRKEFG